MLLDIIKGVVISLITALLLKFIIIGKENDKSAIGCTIIAIIGLIIYKPIMILSLNYKAALNCVFVVNLLIVIFNIVYLCYRRIESKKYESPFPNFDKKTLITVMVSCIIIISISLYSYLSFDNQLLKVYNTTGYPISSFYNYVVNAKLTILFYKYLFSHLEYIMINIMQLLNVTFIVKHFYTLFMALCNNEQPYKTGFCDKENDKIVLYFVGYVFTCPLLYGIVASSVAALQ